MVSKVEESWEEVLDQVYSDKTCQVAWQRLRRMVRANSNYTNYTKYLNINCNANNCNNDWFKFKYRPFLTYFIWFLMKSDMFRHLERH